MIATPVAAFFTSSVFINISSTSAVSVAVDESMNGIPTNQRAGALVVLVLQAATLSRNESLLILTGISSGVQGQLIRMRTLHRTGKENIYLAAPQLGQALNTALRDQSLAGTRSSRSAGNFNLRINHIFSCSF